MHSYRQRGANVTHGHRKRQFHQAPLTQRHSELKAYNKQSPLEMHGCRIAHQIHAQAQHLEPRMPHANHLLKMHRFRFSRLIGGSSNAQAQQILHAPYASTLKMHGWRVSRLLLRTGTADQVAQSKQLLKTSAFSVVVTLATHRRGKKYPRQFAP